MHAIQQVIIEIKKMGGIENSQGARDLRQLVNGANNYLQSTEPLNTQPVPRVNHTQHLSTGERITDNRKTYDRQPLPRVSQPTTHDEPTMGHQQAEHGPKQPTLELKLQWLQEQRNDQDASGNVYQNA
jgi:hypothetical protein